MTLPDLSTPKTDPPMVPWWAHLLVALMAAGVIVALAVYARQGWHRAEGKATAAEVHAVRDRVEEVRGEVDYLRDFVEEVRGRADANERRLEAVEEGQPR